MPTKRMTKSASSRIQSSQAKHRRDMSSSGFAARAQSAGDKRSNTNASKRGGDFSAQTSSINTSDAGTGPTRGWFSGWFSGKT
ncbi:hypothetical protein BKA61DRAFT_614944 [Leptodontidium sp. MPI-SDFR-AT-0119]|nr:hypothetical protein BKA61DRAFT_614944 [Leptodontidium sp. MPI-SDFR-AT-0119]